uniref:Uncharacterized protein n=1 Tax=Chromera velia CCMP2878 TaxID=1169474 RepID=A0A0G4G074_9ALVE|eukprot:Cvel_19504.t1-p1 / transcript=Cvel_19504.t1 / gene=Cvel_19504 / organism=Chromera_velia_CCMP2878 / gene_product=hypothetical protein / transcript_product=hypothetical protein / location=Cvel_scaffold1687:16876-18207(-) / protein_length=444 / sequence_SO=supercontig / SO=protein_coding / is_pseudo=false
MVTRRFLSAAAVAVLCCKTLWMQTEAMRLSVKKDHSSAATNVQFPAKVDSPLLEYYKRIWRNQIETLSQIGKAHPKGGHSGSDSADHSTSDAAADKCLLVLSVEPPGCIPPTNQPQSPPSGRAEEGAGPLDVSFTLKVDPPDPPATSAFAEKAASGSTPTPQAADTTSAESVSESECIEMARQMDLFEAFKRGGVKHPEILRDLPGFFDDVRQNFLTDMKEKEKQLAEDSKHESGDVYFVKEPVTLPIEALKGAFELTECKSCTLQMIKMKKPGQTPCAPADAGAAVDVEIVSRFIAGEDGGEQCNKAVEGLGSGPLAAVLIAEDPKWQPAAEGSVSTAEQSKPSFAKAKQWLETSGDGQSLLNDLKTFLKDQLKTDDFKELETDETPLSLHAMTLIRKKQKQGVEPDLDTVETESITLSIPKEEAKEFFHIEDCRNDSQNVTE